MSLLMHAKCFVNQAKSRLSTLQNSQYLLNMNDVSRNVLGSEKQYGAFTGKVMQASQVIQNNLKRKDRRYNFIELIDLQLGSMQHQGQKALTFNRQVLSGLVNPELVGKKIFSVDAENRIRFYQQQLGSQWNAGVLTDGQGLQFVRESIASFIQSRDKSYNQESIENISLCEGVLKGINKKMQHFIKNTKDGVLVPCPKYPHYSSAAILNGAQECHYQLNERNDWQISLPELEQSYRQAQQKGIKIKIIIVCNPNNPTGGVLTKQSIQDILKFSFNNKVIVFADEVYQDNVYSKNKKFLSFKSARDEMEKPYNQTELISFHSTSCGFMGEGGFKGGYLQMSGIDPEIIDKLSFLRSQGVGSNTIGQICVDLMCNPPKKGLVTDETFETYSKEREEIYKLQKENVERIAQELNKMTNISSNEIQGSIYAYPQIKFTDKQIQDAKKKEESPDVYYALKMLYETGIAMVPGSYFGDQQGAFHLRMSTIFDSKLKLEEFLKKFKAFNENFQKGMYKD